MTHSARPFRPTRVRRLAAAAVWVVAVAGGALVGTAPAAAETDPSPAATSWSLAGDWAAQWNAPGGPSNAATDRWQYFGVSSADEGNPDAYVLADDSAPTTCAASGVDQVWRNRADGTNVHLAVTDVRGRCAPNLTIPAGTVDLGPGGTGRDVGVRWTSPITGTVSVTGFVSDNDHGGGDGVSWSLRDGAGTVLTAGSFGNGGEQALADGSGGPAALQSVAVTQGQQLIFLVNPDPDGGTGGNHLYDNTGLNLAISRLPSVTAGAVLTWGANSQGQLGTGDFTARAVPGPTTLPGGTHVVSVAAGTEHVLALAGDGTLYAWGSGTAGQLGDGVSGDPSSGDYHYSLTPQRVDLPDGATVAEIAAAGTTSLALTAAGNVYAWGANGSGQLGDGTTSDSAVPVPVHLPAGVRATAVATGGGTSLALADDGSVYSWGENRSGELGTGSPDYYDPAPARVALPEGTVIETVSAGLVHCLALAEDGTVWAWGRNYQGGLGGGTTGDAATPIPVPFPDGVDVVGVSAGDVYSLAVDAEGDAYSWGSATFGLLGNGRTEDAPAPQPVTLPPHTEVARVVAGQFTAFALTTSGRLLGWGNNISGQLGSGDVSQQRDLPAPVPLAALGRIADVAIGDYAVASAGDDPTEPIADLAATTPTSGEAPFTVTFDASGSTAADGASYVFTCGDLGVPAQAGFAAPTASCTYTGASPEGGFQAYVAIRDPGTDQVIFADPIRIDVTEPPPVARLAADITAGAAPLTVSLDAGASTIPDGATFTFHCGDDDTVANSDPSATAASCTYRRGSPVGGWPAWVSMHDPATGRDYQDTVYVQVEPPADTVDGSSAFDPDEWIAAITVASDGSLAGDGTDCGGAELVFTTCVSLEGETVRLTAVPGTFDDPDTVVHLYRGDAGALDGELPAGMRAEGGFAVTWTPAVDLVQPLIVTVLTDDAASTFAPAAMRPMNLDVGGFFRGLADGIVSGATKAVQTIGAGLNAAASAIGSLWQHSAQTATRPNGSRTNNVLFCAGISHALDQTFCYGPYTVLQDVPTDTISALTAGGSVIAAGGGNVIAAGGGNVISYGGGNVIAAGGGNVIAAGGGNVIAAGGGNVIAAGGGNVIAAGGGNLTLGLTRDPGLGFVTPDEASAPVVTATPDAEPGTDGTYPAGTTVTVTIAASGTTSAAVQNVSYSATGADAAPHTIAAGSSTPVVVDAAGRTVITYSAQDALGNQAEPRTIEIVIGPSPASAPTDVVAAADPGLTSATVSWTAPADPGSAPVTGYVVTALDLGPIDGGSADPGVEPLVVRFDDTATTQAITGLTAGHRYLLAVAADNGNAGALSDAVSFDLVTAPDGEAPPDEGGTGEDQTGGDQSGGDQTGGPGPTVPSGGTAWSAPEHVPSPGTPVIAAVTGPDPGTVTFAPTGPAADRPGYTMIGSGFVITAPAGTAADPLRLAFRIDAAVLPAGSDPAWLTVFRDGVPVPACADPTATAADPDPCRLPTTGTAGVVTVTVLSSHASAWTFGVTAGSATTGPLPRPAQRPVLSAISRTAGTVNVAVQTHPAVAARKVRLYAVYDPGPGRRKVLRYLGFAITDPRGRAHAVLDLAPGRQYVLKARMAGRDYAEHLSERFTVTVRG